MGIFKRVSDIISANLNELVDGFEDPEKMLKQAVREMEAAIETALDGAVKVIANEKLLDKQLAEQRRLVDCWQDRAREAVHREDDEAARTALARKAEHEKLAAALEDQAATAQTAGRKLRRQIDAMRVRLAEARRKQVSLTARKQAAGARKRILSDLGGSAVNDEAFARFDRMSTKIEQAEAEADALLELTGHELQNDDVDEQTVDSAIEAELQALKTGIAASE